MTISKQDRIFITGANGFIGQFMVDVLRKNGYSNLILNKRGDLKNSRECANIALTNAVSIQAFFNKFQPEHIIHLAALARIKDGETDPDNAYMTNYLGTKIFIEEAIKNGVKSFVFVSSDLVRNHKSVVGITKFLAESYIQDLEKNNTRFVTVRIPNVSWTPGSVHLIFERLINENKAITITHPDMSRRFIAGKEAADFIQYGLENGKNKDIFVVSKDPDKITHLAHEMIKESGKSLEIEYIGIKPGEKLAEESYQPDEVEHTGFEDLALLKRKNFSEQAFAETMAMLRNKTGFTFVTEKVTHD